jgi:hypothetical protein
MTMTPFMKGEKYQCIIKLGIILEDKPPSIIIDTQLSLDEIKTALDLYLKGAHAQFLSTEDLSVLYNMAVRKERTSVIN